MALATSICGIGEPIIVATGALSTVHDDTESSSVFRSDDVRVQPVSSLPEKLNILLSEIEKGYFREIIGSKEFWVIIPKLFNQAEQVREASAMKQVRALLGFGVKVVPVDWLSEALNVLNAHKTHYLALDRLLQVLVCTLIVIIVSYGSWVYWRNAEIPMAFISATSRVNQSEPFELCAMGSEQYALPIRKTLMAPTLPVEATMAWRTIVGDPNSLDSRLVKIWEFGGYYIAIVVLSEFSPSTFDYVRIDNTSRPLRVSPGQTYEGWMKLNDRAEVNALVLLAQRHAPFDANQVREQFYEYFPRSAAPPLNIDAAMNFVKTLAPGSLIYPFSSLEEPSKCIYQK